MACAIAILWMAGGSVTADDTARGAGQERVEDFGALVPRLDSPPSETAPLQIERITTAIPWPRGLAFVDDELVVLARGRHRRDGGLDPDLDDRAGTLFAVDPTIAEPVVAGELAGTRVRRNGRVLAAPTRPPFFLYDRVTVPTEARLIDRPYCTLVFDHVSRNLFICGFSGIDLPAGRFRKNATDSIHRFDLRTRQWYTVEQHNPHAAPDGESGPVMSNAFYPHHDPSSKSPPHGWLNGADGGCVVGDFLYCAGKDNHVIVRYDLAEIRQDPEAPPPDGRPVSGSTVTVRHPGGERTMQALGPSAIAAHDGYLFIGYRTSSVVLRFAIDERGRMIDPKVGELIAVFEPWDPATGRSANLIDIAFNSAGELFVSCSTEKRIWKVGVPDPARPFYGNDQTDRPTTARPYIDLSEAIPNGCTCGNILFDDADRLYVCASANDTGSATLKGAVYRITPAD